jgi:molybdopterin-guanine dinucleotide biosynthesis protein A
MQNLVGVVLCGGQSKRMGQDKGLMPVHNTIRAKYIADKLSFLDIPVVFSINAGQQAGYAEYISPDKLIIDNVAVEGPLKGLLTAHAALPGNDILLLACDMLDLDEGTIVTLIHTYQTAPGFDAYVYQDDEYAQPMCGIYKEKRLQELLLKAGEHAVHQYSMQKVLDDGNTRRIPIINHEPFHNYNRETT